MNIKDVGYNSARKMSSPHCCSGFSAAFEKIRKISENECDNHIDMLKTMQTQFKQHIDLHTHIRIYTTVQNI